MCACVCVCVHVYVSVCMRARPLGRALSFCGSTSDRHIGIMQNV